MRSDREILRVANKNVKDLTNDEFDRYQELMRMPVKDRYAKASGGKVQGSVMVEQQRRTMLGARARLAEDALLSGEELSDEQIAGYLKDLNEANMSGAISSKYDPYDSITLSVVKKVNSPKGRSAHKSAEKD